MLVKDIRGLKFPDEAVTRFFFKESLGKRTGRVLELGCGNGSNLMLFYQYGWDVTGVDNGKTAIEDANFNFKRSRARHHLKNGFDFYLNDMISFAEGYDGPAFDAVLLPNSIYYLHYDGIKVLFVCLRENRMLKKGSLIFIRTRLPEDHRYGKGRQLGKNTFKLDIKETGEYGCLCTFLTEKELVKIVEGATALDYKHVLHFYYDNLQDGRLIANKDMVLWGKIKGLRSK